METFVKILSEIPASWNASLETSFDAQGVTVVHLHLEAQEELPPPRMQLGICEPITDIANYWTPEDPGTRNLKPDWLPDFESNIARNAPLCAFISASDQNRLTVSLSEALRPIRFVNGVHELDSTLVVKMELFYTPEAPLKSYDMDIRIDRRRIFFAEAIRQASAWFENYDLYKPTIPPAGAYESIYSTWYSYHQNLFQDQIEAQCEQAKDFGLKGIIVDDGWQTDDNHCSYGFCGEWQVTRRRFPDMRAHVARVHAMGLRYLLWFSVPFVGFYTEAYKKFQGKFVYESPRHHAGVLDPRFPEVREYLIGIYENAVRDWDLDGLKLDFIDRINFVTDEDPAEKENYAGRDIKSLAVAVDVLLSETMRRLKAIKPDLLIEFRQPYIGPAIRKYGNMFRATDCPNDYVANRVRTINLRLTSGCTAVHSDMLEWHSLETPENAAMQFLNILFSVPQISVKLEAVPESHRRMLRFWLDFWNDHHETLLKGTFLPHFPAFKYPIVEAVAANERVVALYNPGMTVAVPAKKVFVVNATQATSLVLEVQDRKHTAVVYDCQGNKVSEMTLATGLQRIQVPPAGLIAID